MGRTKKPTAAELKKIRLVKMIREVTGSGYSPDTWNPAELSDGLKQITYIRNLVDTWNPAQLNEAIKLLGFKTIDSWNPAIIDEMKTALIRMFLPRTATGNPITLNLNGELPYTIQEAKVTFTPKQSGTGDPSPTNIRPISGWDGLNLTRTGKNLAKSYSYNSEIISYSNGVVSVVGTASGNIKRPTSNAAVLNNYTTLLKAGTYKPSLEITPPEGIVLNILDSEGNSLSLNGATFTLSKDTLVFPRVDISAGTYDYTSGIMIELGSTATAYEPYQGETYPATFDNTVPGGTYDFVSGKGGEVWKDYLINDLTLTYSSSGQLFTSQGISELLTPASSREMIDGNMCEFLKNHEVTGLESGQFAITTDGRIRIKIDGYTTEEDLKNAFGTNKLTLKLSTPTPIELTGQEVEPLPSVNVFSTDGDSLDLKYQIDLS